MYTTKWYIIAASSLLYLDDSCDVASFLAAYDSTALNNEQWCLTSDPHHQKEDKELFVLFAKKVHKINMQWL
jgi:hypothetical protein